MAMSSNETLWPTQPDAMASARKPWRAPEVIVAQARLETAKTYGGGSEAHSAFSLATSS